MANAAAKMFTSFLESKGTKFQVLDDEGSVVRVGWQLEATGISIFFQFGDDNTDIHMEGTDFLTFPAEKLNTMYKLCNDMNRQYRWVKFTVKEDRKEVICECDAVIQLDSCAAEATELMLRMNNIVDKAYPYFMKGLWA